jgi:phospholipase C
LSDAWNLAQFADGLYHLRIHGPNGFYRELRGNAQDPDLAIRLAGSASEPRAILTLHNSGTRDLTVEIADLSYGQPTRAVAVPAGAKLEVALNLASSQGWYDLGLNVTGQTGYARRYSGHVETGRDSVSDPLLG